MPAYELTKMVKLVLLVIAIILASTLTFSQNPDLSSYKTIPEKIKALDSYIDDCLRNEKFDEAKTASLLALRLSKQTTIDSLITKSIYNVGASYNKLSNFDSAI